MAKKKRGRRGNADDRKRDAPVSDEGQVYGRVLKMLGNGRLLAKCGDGEERQCRIRGSMRRREWIRPGDTVLIALRPFEGDKADVIHRYQPADLQKLVRQGEAVQIAADEDEAAMDDVVAFEGEEELPELPRRRRDMPDSGTDSGTDSSEDDVDWERI